jgi:hypothetical protein
MSLDDDFLTAGSLPDVTVDTEGALERTHRRGIRRRRQRRAAVASLGAVLVAVTGTVAGLRFIDDGTESTRTGPGDASTTTEEPVTTSSTTTSSTTTTSSPASSSTTTTSSTTTSAGPAPSSGCTREAVAASLGYRLDEVLSDPVCHDGWGWVNACPASERDPEVGCEHAGKIIRIEGERWIFVAALLQDCAESFTAYGAPPDVAERFYPRCF